MKYTGGHTSRETYIQRYLTDLLVNLTPLEGELSTESSVSGQLEWAASALACHQFFKNWYQDMLEHPDAYGLPVEDYPDEAERFDRCIKEFLAISKIRDPNLKHLIKHHERKSKAVSAVTAISNFLLQLGEKGVLNGDSLVIDSLYLNEGSGTNKKKRAKASFESLLMIKKIGFTYEVNGEQTILFHSSYPKMFLAFNRLCIACSDNKKIRFFFSRCDFRALNPTFKWTLEDIIRSLPQPDRSLLLDLDKFMKALKYRTVIEFENRYAYALKQGVIFRIELEGERYHFYFRWPLKSENSTKIFKKLHLISPTLAEMVLEGLLPCRPDCNPGYGADYEHCGARVAIEFNEKRICTCTDAGWPVWGHSSEDMKHIQDVAKAIKEVLSENN